MEQDQTSGKQMSAPDRRMLVLGCGSIGKRHIRNLLSVGAGKIAACDISEKKRDEVRQEFSIEVFGDLRDALLQNRYDAAFICTPPSYHVEQARQLLANDTHCFIEKPLSNAPVGIDEIITLAESRQKIVLIGYPLRFSPYLRKIKEMMERGHIGKVLFVRASVGYYLPYWRPQEDYREGYGAKRELGGGIVLDASHEIDYVRYLIGEIKEVFAVCQKLSSLEIDTEDFAEITLHNGKGTYAQIHLDYLQSNYRRSCEVIGEDGMLIWDINERTLRHYSRDDKAYHCYYEGLNANVNDLYLDEIGHFLACVEGRAQPLIGLEEGKRLQEIIERIRNSSESGKLLSV